MQLLHCTTPGCCQVNVLRAVPAIIEMLLLFQSLILCGALQCMSDLISSSESAPQTYRHTTLIYKLNYFLFAHADLHYSLSDI